MIRKLTTTQKMMLLLARTCIWKQQRLNFSKLGSTFNQGLNEQHQSDSETVANKLLDDQNRGLRLKIEIIIIHFLYKNIFLSIKGGLFNIKDLSTLSGFYVVRQRAESRDNLLVDEALNKTNDFTRRRKTVEIFDDISNELCRVADAAEFVRTTHPDLAYRVR